MKLTLDPEYLLFHKSLPIVQVKKHYTSFCFKKGQLNQDISTVKIFQRLQRNLEKYRMYFFSPDKNMEDITDVNNFTYTNLTWFIFFKKLLYIKITHACNFQDS